jgi:anti-sigma regulatory factor (Ser/Thr protein kinase)
MKKLMDYFTFLRFNKNFHLGHGDIRLTIAMQECVANIAKEAAQHSVQRTAISVGALAFFAGLIIGRFVSHGATRRR